MSIADSPAFKRDRAEAVASKDIKAIRAWAARYGVKLPANDEECLRLAALVPVWD